MKGLYKTATGEGNLELREIPVPEPGPGQVLVEVKAAGICGSDLHILHADMKLPMKPPVIIGHEFSGVISALGKEVVGWKEGERVTAETSASICGTCYYCRTGSYNLCSERKILGYWIDGGFAEYTLVPAHRLHRLPENVDFIDGALTEPLACCVHGIVELMGMRTGDTVVVSGPGAIGLISMQIAKAYGGQVIVLGTSKDGERLKKAEELGADRTVNIDDEDPHKIVQDITDGLGADVAIECSGAAQAVDTDFDLLRKRGKYLQVGLFYKPITIDFEKIAYKELSLYGTLSQRWTAWKRSLLLMAQEKVKLSPLVTDIFPLSEWKNAFETFESKKGLKVILTPHP
jgi:L-iditol 2-dehydrogenase